MSADTVDHEALLTPGEVAVLFRVDPKTVARWAQAGKLSAVRTLGGHRRFLESEIRALVVQAPEQRAPQVDGRHVPLVTD